MEVQDIIVTKVPDTKNKGPQSPVLIFISLLVEVEEKTSFVPNLKAVNK